MLSRRIVWTLDWFGRIKDMADVARLIPWPIGGGVIGWLAGGLLGALLGIGGAVFLVVIIHVTTFALERLWPLPEISAIPEPVNGEWGYGRSVNGRLTAAFVIALATANNPGRWEERITNMYCDLIRQRFLVFRQVVERLPLEPSLPGWRLPAGGEPESKKLKFHKTHVDYKQATKLPIGEELIPIIIVEFGSPRRTKRVFLPEIPVRGPYPE